MRLRHRLDPGPALKRPEWSLALIPDHYSVLVYNSLPIRRFSGVGWTERVNLDLEILATSRKSSYAFLDRERAVAERSFITAMLIGEKTTGHGNVPSGPNDCTPLVAYAPQLPTEFILQFYEPINGKTDSACIKVGNSSRPEAIKSGWYDAGHLTDRGNSLNCGAGNPSELPQIYEKSPQSKACNAHG
ncbi:hypothetical protein N7468_005775 [Penicillium chermesinum]|uniref:Uncharacterized protein n=1 Tax=Penicillium chermesinum TaxID=63820 RepID=A0A9W9NZN7_9EURO|nr:uncharacterized protein N7468_005775 [Penicillium chermesinum]KAJ5232819.1 hypothetical protein N7468_005775 [Penicillium chermesinum]KAJ6172474.1 hypothetical protein N7470_001541 [Penicillium chermesinum]